MDLLVLAGPTAIGKTAIALELVRRLGWLEIVSADSMQVYKFMDIGTAKPTEEERGGIPYHLIDIVYPDDTYSAGRYSKDAKDVVEGIRAKGKIPMIVGGTGLYIRALVDGMFEMPPVPTSVRKRLFEEAEAFGLDFLYRKLRDLDPETARRIHPNDRVRIIRALEIAELTGSVPSALRTQWGKGSRFNALMICLWMEKDRLHKRIEDRVDKMIEAGFLDEVKGLLDMGYGEELVSMRSIGYRHMVRVIKGELELGEAVEIMKRDTKLLAKRQMTWFRGDKRYEFLHVGEDLEEVVRALADRITSRLDSEGGS
jgi:tRNA dimethylallyltransferase